MKKLFKQKDRGGDIFFTYIHNFNMNTDDDRYRSYCDYNSHFRNITRQIYKRTEKREYIYTLLLLNYKGNI